MAAPSSATVSAPKRESAPPTIQTRNTSPTEPADLAIALGTRNTPVPMMWPTTIAIVAHGPSPCTSSNFFSPMSLRFRSASGLQLLRRRLCAYREAARQGSYEKRHHRADKEIPRKRYFSELKYAQDSG